MKQPPVKGAAHVLCYFFLVPLGAGFVEPFFLSFMLPPFRFWG